MVLVVIQGKDSGHRGESREVRADKAPRYVDQADRSPSRSVRVGIRGPNACLINSVDPRRRNDSDVSYSFSRVQYLCSSPPEVLLGDLPTAWNYTRRTQWARRRLHQPNHR